MTGAPTTTGPRPLADCRVLVVEDDALLTMLVEQLLVEMGCTVVAKAARFAEAARMAESLEYDIALLDINLHGERIFPIAEALLARGQAFVLVSGYGAAVLPDGLNAVPLLQKPYRRAELEDALWDALHCK